MLAVSSVCPCFFASRELIVVCVCLFAELIADVNKWCADLATIADEFSLQTDGMCANVSLRCIISALAAVRSVWLELCLMFILSSANLLAELLVDRIMRVCRLLHDWFRADSDDERPLLVDGRLNPHGNFHVREVERTVALVLGQIGLVYPNMQIVQPITVAAFEKCLRDICVLLQRIEQALGAYLFVFRQRVGVMVSNCRLFLP